MKTQDRYLYRFTWAMPDGAWLIDPRLDVVIRWEPWKELLKIGAVPDREYHRNNFIDCLDITQLNEWNSAPCVFKPVSADRVHIANGSI